MGKNCVPVFCRCSPHSSVNSDIARLMGFDARVTPFGKHDELQDQSGPLNNIFFFLAFRMWLDTRAAARTRCNTGRMSQQAPASLLKNEFKTQQEVQSGTEASLKIKLPSASSDLVQAKSLTSETAPRSHEPIPGNCCRICFVYSCSPVARPTPAATHFMRSRRDVAWRAPGHSIGVSAWSVQCPGSRRV